MVTSKDGNRLIVNKGAFQAAQEVKNLPVNAGDAGSIPGLGKSPGEENGKSLQYSCLGNPMDRGAWQAIRAWGRKKRFSSVQSLSHV